MLDSNTSFIAISTLTSEMNFYTKLIGKVDPLTNQPVFKSVQIQLACQQCIDNEKASPPHINPPAPLPPAPAACTSGPAHARCCPSRRDPSRRGSSVCICNTSFRAGKTATSTGGSRQSCPTAPTS